MLQSCHFRNYGSIKIMKTIAILNDCHNLNESYFGTTNSSVVIKGGSEFVARTLNEVLYSFSIDVTLSGRISFTNISGAIALHASTLHIVAGTSVTFVNNSAPDSGGAIFLYLSTLYVVAGASLKYINNSAGDRGGTIYL